MPSIRNLLTRRDLFKVAAAGVAGYSQSGWLEATAQVTAAQPHRRRSCILLWMQGGPSTIDMFDMKPGHRNGGPFHEIATTVPGIRISEYLPRLASSMKDMAIIRSMSTREGNHAPGAMWMHTGYPAIGPVRYPSLGALVAKELPNHEIPLPNFVALFPPPEGCSAGFLAPYYDPLIIGSSAQAANNAEGVAVQIPNARPPAGLSQAEVDPRIDFLMELQRDFVARHPGYATDGLAVAYSRAVRLMRSGAASAFNLDAEPAALRERYGRTNFAQGCLLARRLVERGVPFVEVALGDWDTHDRNFPTTHRLSEIVDVAWSALMDDLRARGLLDSTLIIWMGEFGRTPRIDHNRGGRHHWPNSFSVVLAGGGIRGGQVYGQTSPDGMVVETAPVDTKSLLATVWRALGVDHTRSNISNVGRPIRLADAGAVPVTEIVGD